VGCKIGEGGGGETNGRGFDLAGCGLAGAEDEAGDFDCWACQVEDQLCSFVMVFEWELTVVRLGWEFLAGDELAGHVCLWFERENVGIESRT
jgi:hypothetical protein